MAEKIKLYLISFCDEFGRLSKQWCLEKPNSSVLDSFSVVSESFFFLPDGFSVSENRLGYLSLYDSKDCYCPLYTQYGKPFICTDNRCCSLKELKECDSI